MLKKLLGKKTEAKALTDVSRLIRLQTRLDLTISSDWLNGHGDVRSSIILETTGDNLIIAQPNIPILRSMVGQEVEASVVSRQPDFSDPVRWAWPCRIVDLQNNFKLSSFEGAEPVPVVYLSRPAPLEVKRGNVRLAYRLDIFGREDILLNLSPELPEVALIDFSVGGLKLRVSRAGVYQVGQELKFALHFLANDDFPETSIKGLAQVVRVEEAGTGFTLGLKFIAFDEKSAINELHRIANAYMLMEQRRRHDGL